MKIESSKSGFKRITSKRVNKNNDNTSRANKKKTITNYIDYPNTCLLMY